MRKHSPGWVVKIQILKNINRFSRKDAKNAKKYKKMVVRLHPLCVLGVFARQDIYSMFLEGGINAGVEVYC